MKREADDWLDREVKLPDRGGQWFHWYSCPKHGARLRTESPTRHVCSVGKEVYTGYPYDDVALSAEHDRLSEAIRTLGIVYQITADPRYANKAKQILLAYADKYKSYPLHIINGQPKVGGGKIGPQTLDESTWLISAVEGADCIWETLTGEEQKHVKEDLIYPATDVIQQHRMRVHNIQCWKNAAVGLAGLLMGDMALVNEAINGPVGYSVQMAEGVTADGPWFEGAWGYHFYTLSAVLHLTEGAYHSGINLYGPELQRMFQAPLAMAAPDLTLPAFNDSHPVDVSRYAGPYATALVRYGDSRFAAVAARARGSAQALLSGIPRIKELARLQVKSCNFPAAGNAILAAGKGSDATWLCMKYGPHGGGHGHPDKLNFVLYGFGALLAPDPGTANYGVPIQKGWYRTTLAHNTLSIDELSQQPSEGKCEAFTVGERFSAVMADAGKLWPGVKYRRTVALIGTGLLVFVDQIESEATHTYDLAYHNCGRLDESAAGDFVLPEKAGYPYLRDCHADVSSNTFRLKFTTGEDKSVGWAMAGGEQTTYITGTGVGRHTEDRVPLVIARRQAKSTTYTWCVSLGVNSVELEPQDIRTLAGVRPEPSSAAAVRVKTGSEAYVLVANASGEPVVVGSEKVEDKIAVLTMQNH